MCKKKRRKAERTPLPESVSSVFIRGDVADAVNARLILWAADMFFEAQPEPTQAFTTNPANTLPYRALNRLEEMAIVRIVETLDLKDESLRYHRVILAHPGQVRFGDPKVQAFLESGRARTDFRPQLVWQLQKEINARLEKAGKPTRALAVTVTTEMATTLQTILGLAANEDTAVPDRASLQPWLEKAKDVYVQRLEAPVT